MGIRYSGFSMTHPTCLIMHPFLSVGFRPFYAGAAAFAVIAVPFWTVPLINGTGGPPLSWHAHEMVFGFGGAVIAGFLLTAVRTWTGRATPSGYPLLALLLLWVAGRVANFLSLPGGPWIDAAFLPTVAVILAVPLLQARNHRNLFVVVLLMGLGVASLCHQTGVHERFFPLPARQVMQLALDLVLALMIVIGGRVIPAFSKNAVRGLQPMNVAAVEVLAIGVPVVLLVTDSLASDGGGPPDWFLYAAAAIHVIRLLGWQPWKTRHEPLLLALPLAYAWIPIHLVLRAAAPEVSTHALTLGAMASLMLAMMTRSALGHTGRALTASPPERVCFLAIHGAAVARVFGPLSGAGDYRMWLAVATTLWCLAFATFTVSYWPILTRPRIDQSST
jgi:uncharacterized protein involved in response to NO